MKLTDYGISRRVNDLLEESQTGKNSEYWSKGQLEDEDIDVELEK